MYRQAEALAGNLASLWNGGRTVLGRIASAADGPDGSPWRALRELGPRGVESLFSGPQREELDRAFHALTRYLVAEAWFDRARTGDDRLDVLQRRPVAYFCAEFGLASWLPMYSGGLGVLAGDVLKEASDLGLPLAGIGLFYRQGFFQQSLDGSGYQRESSPTLDPQNLPLTPVQDSSGNVVLVEIPMADRTVLARAWSLQVGRTPLYLLDTDVPENDRAEDREITSTLYGGDQETRIRQEIVLGIGGVRLLRALDLDPSIYSMNEGHAAFLGLELLAESLVDADAETAISRNRCRIVYTNHTVVPAGNDIFPRDLVAYYLGAYAERTGIGAERLLGLAGPDGAPFSMALLAFRLSGKANAVSELHGTVIPREWPGHEVEVVTNGVHLPTWVGGEIAALLGDYVPGWRGDNPPWEAIHTIPDKELQEAHARQRREMVAAVNAAQTDTTLDPARLTLVWARRFAEYKRAGLLTSDVSRLKRLLCDPARPVQLVISGKAHPHDEGAKHILQDILHRVHSDEGIASRVAFVVNYNERVARSLTSGADVWVNTPRKPFEASGTSGMKSGTNGGLQLTVRDGWAAEVDWWGTGWGIDGGDDSADAEQLYGYLEDSVVPLFYRRDEDGVAHEWAAMMKNTMILTCSRYSARRMLHDYLTKLYLPLLEQQGLTSQAPGR